MSLVLTAVLLSGVAAAAVQPLAQRRAQQREAAEPFGRLHDYLQHRVDEVRVSLAASRDGRLERERARGLQTALDGHQAELVGEVVRVYGVEPARAPLFEEEEAALAHLCERGQARASVEQERDEVVARGPHPRVLIVYDAEPALRVH